MYLSDEFTSILSNGPYIIQIENTKAKRDAKNTIKVSFLYPFGNVSSLYKIPAIIKGLKA